MSFNNKFKNNLIKAGATVAAGTILSTSALAQHKTAERDFIQAVPTNNNMIVVDDNLTADPFKHAIKGQNTYLGFKLKDSNDEEIKYKVITYQEFKDKANKAIVYKIHREAGLVDKVKMYFGHTVHKETADGRILNYIEHTPYHKLSECDKSLADLVTKYVNNTDKILTSNGKYISAKAVITPTEYNSIIKEMRKLGIKDIVIPVVGSTPKDGVMEPVLFEDITTQYNQSTPKKTPSAPEPKKQETPIVENKFNADSLTNVLRQEIANEQKDRRDIKSLQNVQTDYGKKVQSIDSTIKVIKSDIDSLKVNSHPADTMPRVAPQQVNTNIYLGFGEEHNPEFQRWIMEVNGGAYIGRVNLGLSYGHSTTFADIFGDKLANHFGFPQDYSKHLLPQIINNIQGNGYSEIRTNINYDITQLGAEFGVDVASIGRSKKSNDHFMTVRLLARTQYNIVRADTTGEVEQFVTDGTHPKHVIWPMEATSGHIDYWSANPEIEFKTKHVSAYAGVKFPIHTKYDIRPSINFGVKGYFGNKRKQ